MPKKEERITEVKYEVSRGKCKTQCEHYDTKLVGSIMCGACEHFRNINNTDKIVLCAYNTNKRNK